MNDDEVNHMVLEGLLGPIHKATTNKELIDQGYSSKMNIKAILLTYLDVDKKMVRGMDYPEEVKWLVKHPARHRFICNLAKSMSNNTLVLFTLIEHGKNLYETIRTGINGRNVYFIYGKTPGDEREEIRKIVNKEINAIIVASYRTLSLGINIPNLHNMIFAAPAKSEYIVSQSIGRMLRVGDDKELATIYDIVDDVAYKDKLNYALKHFRERINIYNAEQFPYKMIKVHLAEDANERNKDGLLGMI
jgi:superfamily II DNA or RNA helicase